LFTKTLLEDLVEIVESGAPLSFEAAMAVADKAGDDGATKPAEGVKPDDPSKPATVADTQPAVDGTGADPSTTTETVPDDAAAAAAATASATGKSQEETTPEIPKELKELFPESTDVVSSVKELREKFTSTEAELREADAVLEDLYHIIDSSPIVRKTLTLINGGVQPIEAMRQAMDMSEEELADGVPNPADDPKRYEEFYRRRLAKEANLRQQQESEENRHQAAEKAQRKAVADRTAFQKKHGYSEEYMDQLLRWTQEQLYANPKTGELPANFLEVVDSAYTRERDMKSAVEKAKIEGRNEVLKTKLAPRTTGDGIPAPKGSGKPATPSEHEIMARSFIHNRRFVEDTQAAR
jgi:hypothetical protein